MAGRIGPSPLKGEQKLAVASEQLAAKKVLSYAPMN